MCVVSHGAALEPAVAEPGAHCPRHGADQCTRRIERADITRYGGEAAEACDRDREQPGHEQRGGKCCRGLGRRELSEARLCTGLELADARVE